jgi:hypothetical protein
MIRSRYLEDDMRRFHSRRWVLVALAGLAVLVPVALSAQAQSVSPEQLANYAKAFQAIGKLRDQFHADASAAQNKKAEAQQQLHEKLRADVLKAIADAGLTEPEYNRITFVVSTDAEARKALDTILGIAPPAPPPAPTQAAGAAAGQGQSGNPHIGHVMTAFAAAPGGKGLLPTAMSEGAVVVQHAGLAARNTGNLDAMKLHAGHIIHAIEPGEGTSGPGSGYGLKKAAENVAAHIELAGKANGASQNIVTHSVHIATAARNTVKRADEILALAQQIQGATSATAAAELVARLNTIAGQLIPGFDANGDGRIGWQEGEGGLAQAEQHVNLMMQAERR